MKTDIYEIKQVDFNLLKTIDTSFYCSFDWISFLQQNQKGKPILLEICSQGVPIAYFVSVLVKKMGIKVLGSPFEGWLTPDMGFIVLSEIDYDKAICSIVDYSFRKIRCHYVQICDKKINNDIVSIKHKIDYTQLLSLDLTKTEEEILNGFTKNGRRDVRASQRKGIIVKRVPFNYEFADIYYNQLIDVFAKQGLKPNYKKEKVYEMVDFLKDNQENVLALEALNSDGVVVATVFSFGKNEWAYYVGAASFRQYQGDLPNEALFWEFVLFWKSQGIKHLDLMGYRKYKMKYNPAIIEQPRFIFQKFVGLYSIKKIAHHLIVLVRRIKGCFESKKQL